MSRLYHITWFLGNGQNIEKVGEGEQQAFTKMSPKERQAITMRCERVTKRLARSTDK